MSDPLGSGGRELARQLQEAFAALGEASARLLVSSELLAERAARGRAGEGALAPALAALSEARVELEGVLDALPTGVVLRDADRHVLRLNRAAERALGGLSARELEDSPPASESLASAGAGGWELRRLHPRDGSERIVASRDAGASPSGEGRGSARSIELLEDRSELARFEQRVATRARIAALGSLGIAFAQQLRRPLEAVRTAAGLLAREQPAAGAPGGLAERVVAATRELDALVGGALPFAVQDAPRIAPVESGPLLVGAVDDAVTARAAPGACASPSLPSVARRVVVERVAGDAWLLRQALRELVHNALEAQEGAHAVLRIVAEPDPADAGFVLLGIEDEGPGLDPAHEPRLGEPFFTTKPGGSGLGLALARTIARLHGGELRAGSRAGAPGAAVFLRIPHRPVS